MVGYRSQNEYFETWLRALYVAAIFIGITYMQFSLFYPSRLKLAKYIIYTVHFFAFITAYLVTLTDTIIVHGVKKEYGEPEIIFGHLYPLYICVILIPFVIGFLRHFYLIVKHNTKVVYLLTGYFISANIAFATNLILPWKGIFVINWVGQFFTVVMVSLTTYSILKFNLMNIRFFAVNVGVTILSIITFAQALFADGVKNLLISSIVFFVSLITGGYLVYLSQNERKSLEHTIELNQKIKKINSKLEKANEQLKSLDKLKSEFISLASHQLRSPLTVIKGYASTLIDGVVGEMNKEQSEIVRHMYASAQGLASVVEDFLNVTKIEQGGMQYSFEVVDIKKTVEDLADDMKLVAIDKNLTFDVSIDQTKQYTITADIVKLRQVFLNIIDNSLKYTKEGGLTVSLYLKNKEAIFSVKDSGAGLTEETKKKLFTKFGRGESGALNSGGSGLGLYLAQEIVKAHKGKIEAFSEGAGKGSEFLVRLPSA